MSEKKKKLLNKLYDDMIANDLFEVSSKPHDRDEKIGYVVSYLDRLKSIENNIIRYNKINYLKEFYYKKYIIKEEDISNNYYEMQAKIIESRGLGKVNLTDEIKHKYALNIINNQKKSLDRLLNYFYSADTKYFDYNLKYWAFHGIIKMGKYDKVKNEYQKRSNKTISPFIDINFEALALTIDSMNNYINDKNINDNSLIKVLETFNFSRVYNYIINNLNNVNIDRNNSNEGIWIKYDKDSDSKNLVKSIIGKNTNWCIVSESIAKMQLEDGDIYVFYTKDKNNSYSIPRLCIRMEGDVIAEVRGVLPKQHIELSLIDNLENKLKDFRDGIKFKKNIEDTKKLRSIFKKQNNNVELSLEELKFLYEIDDNILGFGYFKSPIIEQIKRKRNYINDMDIINNQNRLKR